MLTLKAEKRNPEEKAKKLRRDGFITGVLYGKEMKENVSLKFTEKDAAAFIKNAKEGTQAYLELDGKNVDVLVKNIDFDPLTRNIWLWTSRLWWPVKSYLLPFLLYI